MHYVIITVISVIVVLPMTYYWLFHLGLQPLSSIYPSQLKQFLIPYIAAVA